MFLASNWLLAPFGTSGLNNFTFTVRLCAWRQGHAKCCANQQTACNFNLSPNLQYAELKHAAVSPWGSIAKPSQAQRLVEWLVALVELLHSRFLHLTVAHLTQWVPHVKRLCVWLVADKSGLSIWITSPHTPKLRSVSVHISRTCIRFSSDSSDFFILSLFTISYILFPIFYFLFPIS